MQTITTIKGVKVGVAHRLVDLLNDWIEVYQLTGYGETEIVSILYMLGGVK